MSDDIPEALVNVEDDGTVTNVPYAGKLAYVVLIEPEPSADVGRLIAQSANDFQLQGETKADVEQLVAHLAQAFPDHAFKLDWFGDEPAP